MGSIGLAGKDCLLAIRRRDPVKGYGEGLAESLRDGRCGQMVSAQVELRFVAGYESEENQLVEL